MLLTKPISGATGLGVIILGAAAFLTPAPAIYAKDGPKTVPPKYGPVKSTVLFVSWDNVFKGRMEPRIDPTQVSAEGWKAIESIEKSWNRRFETNGSGMKMFMAPRNIRIGVEKARKEPFGLKADRPWEAALNAQMLTILQEHGRFRCWYGAQLPEIKAKLEMQDGRGVEIGGNAFCYAESTDGFTWTKPNIGIYSFNGSKENNILSFADVSATVLHDTHGSPDEQYKTFEFGKLPPEELAQNKGGDFNAYCLYDMISPDGFHWTSLTNQPMIRHFCDTQNVLAWDSLLKKYVGYFRDHQGGRAISRSETEDFHSWPPPQPILEPGPEEAPDGDYYDNCFTTYPGDASLRLLFPSIYHIATDKVDVRMALSREGRAFGWVSHEPVIELGRPGEWDSGQIYASPNLVRFADGRLGLAYDASPRTHNEGFLSSAYKDFSMKTAFGWAIWDDARLAGIESDGEGEFYTHPFRPEGDLLEINFRTAHSGAVKVELLQDGLPVEGYSLADCVPLEGDHIWTKALWKDKTNISTLKGKKVQLHFVLSNAKIFAYRVAAKS